MDIIVLGLAIDGFAAILIAIRDFETVDKKISRKIGRKFIRPWSKRARIGINTLREQGEIHPNETGYAEVLEMCRYHPYRENEIPPDRDIEYLEVIEDVRDHNATNWIHARLETGNKLRIHNAQLNGRKQSISDQKLRRFVDLTRAVPALLLFFGFSIQLLGYL